MNVSLNWLGTHLDVAGKSIKEIDNLFTFAGVEVEGIVSKGITSEKIVVAQIMEAVQHPNADRLKVTQVDAGEGSLRQIVCGAQNYKVGDKVPCALPGAELPNGFTIGETVMRKVGWTGDLPAFMRHVQTDPRFRYTTREEMLADYRSAQARIDASTDRLFDVRPAANYEIRPVEPFRERSASAGSYSSASLDGSRPGIFYLNTYDPPSRPRYEMESLLIHEGSPGHHFQISIARELTGVPRLRRFGGNTAYLEGWGQYAETLGRELGMYTDPYQDFGYLSQELWRAIRLVLDTGIHSEGWTLAQASDYARRNSATSETVIQSEVERFSAIPAQGLAYKIGQLKITELRRRAEGALGPRFDIKAFHRAVLEDGALPLDVLDAKIDRWIAARRQR